MRVEKACAAGRTDRRTLLAGLSMLLIGAGQSGSASSLLRRAFARAGGRRALVAARVLRWTGSATIFAGQRRIAIGVDTEVEPFVHARSTSWLVADGPSKARTMILARQSGWIDWGGRREPMPDAMWRHEVQQFGAYGLMRLVDLEGPHLHLTRDGNRLVVRPREHGASETSLSFDKHARLISLENKVPAPESDTLIPQHFTFEGRMPGPIAWPRIIRIEQDGKPYFELRLDNFSAGPR